MKKVSFLGVLVGGVTDIVATNILTLPIVLYAATKLDLARATSDQWAAALHGNPLLHVLQVAIGLGCSLLAGYIAALLAKHDELLNGALSSWLCLALAIFGFATGIGSRYFVEELLLVPTGPAFGMLGGYLRLKQKRAPIANATAA